jgi:hypothetical protein
MINDHRTGVLLGFKFAKVEIYALDAFEKDVG